MQRPDLNLLKTLDVLLTEGSVARAAQRLRLSPSAMSRALARLRETTGDPLLVRAGRGLVPTPRAIALRDQVHQLVSDAESVLRPAATPDLKQVSRTFTLRTNEGFVENFGANIMARIAQEAPGIRLHFMSKPNKDSEPLRNGSVDLETGVISATTSPELRTQALFRDRFIGVVRSGHPLCTRKITPERYAAAQHIAVSRRGVGKGAIDEALHTFGLERDIVTTVSGFSSALALARTTDLVASVPERHTGTLRADLHSFTLPVPLPEITVALLWHPRLHADPVHQWLRDCIKSICGVPLK
jgi:DNA-binding transcriptional LysR family regulator